MSCCGVDCGCGSGCSCGSGCGGCRMFPDIAESGENKIQISDMGVAAQAKFFEVAETKEGYENGGCNCGSNCACNPCYCN